MPTRFITLVTARGEELGKRKHLPAEDQNAWHDAVANLDELRAHVAGTPYERMLDEP